ncbi:MAG: biotin/lipoyl-binding protein [Candidatus Aegiribacteria sp.]|nr:biotin/lipoyl-binding protein [Candidatus Aegiribacteria sp.]
MDKELNRLVVDDTEYITEVPPESVKTYDGIPDPSQVRAFIPGTAVEVRVKEGDRVRQGDVLLLLDAMKMHNEICSRIPGRIAKVHVSKGETVKKDQLMVTIEKN